MKLKVAASKTAEQWAWIKEKRLQYKFAPVTSIIHGRRFDHARDDDDTLKDAIENFATNTGMKGPSGGQLWKDADNGVHEYSLIELTALRSELKAIKADNYSQVYEHCEALAEQLPLPEDSDVFTEAYWINLFGPVD